MDIQSPLLEEQHMKKITAPWAMPGEDVLRESGGSHGGLRDEVVTQRLIEDSGEWAVENKNAE